MFIGRKRRTPVLIILVCLITLLPVAAGVAQSAAAEQISISMHHYFMQAVSADSLEVREIVTVNNQGAEIPAGSSAIKFTLPEGYRELAFAGGTGEKVETRGQEMVVNAAVPAGESSFQYSYLLPIGAAPHFIVKHRLPYATKVLVVLTPLEGISVISDRFAEGSGAEAQGLRVYTAEDLDVDEEINMVVTVGADAAGAGTVTKPPPNPEFHNPGHIRLWYQSPFKGVNAHLFMVLLFGVPLAGLIYYIAKRRRLAVEASRQKRVDPVEERFFRLAASEKVLLKKIGELDEQRAGGGIDENAYTQLRDAYKKKLVSVKIQLKEFTE